jgi:hypothetical protein
MPSNPIVVRLTVSAGITQAEQPRSSVSKAEKALPEVCADGRLGARHVWMKPEQRDGRQDHW